MNPFLNLEYEPAIESIGDDYYDVVEAAEFPTHCLRFRNDDLLKTVGLQPQNVTEQDFIEAFGKLQGRFPLLALRYHGYQFGEYNPYLGDGRGFLYGQVRGIDGELYDFGTKGSGTTPYSRGGDGRLTLKGGVREVLAAEALHQMGVRTSRCLSLVETGESLWRGDEPSPTRSSVMVRVNRSHIRFGTFERLHHLGRKDLTQTLLDHVIATYYPHLLEIDDHPYGQFYAELVQRVAELAAQWMSSGFCHAVLNTDNMSITGESFDYGPYAFMDQYDPKFTAAYFDYSRRYCYANQPLICRLNLEMLQKPLAAVITSGDMEAGLTQFDHYYLTHYRQRMLNKLGFANLTSELTEDLLQKTIQILQKNPIGYHDFFLTLRRKFSPNWRQETNTILQDVRLNSGQQPKSLESWRQIYHRCLNQLPVEEMKAVAQRLTQHNPSLALIRPEIEAIWSPIVEEDNWEPFNQLLETIRKG